MLVSRFPVASDVFPTRRSSDLSPVDSDGTLQTDTWTLSETSLAGYSASAWSCVGDGTQLTNHITLGLGQVATCTITNDDKPPVLHLRKVVVNDNGGTKLVSDFP